MIGPSRARGMNRARIFAAIHSGVASCGPCVCVWCGHILAITSPRSRVCGGDLLCGKPK